MARLQDRRTLVTGAGSGIGRATALAFAREGARVAVLDRDAEGLAATAQAIADLGGRPVAVPADITSEDEVESAIGAVQDAFGGLDVAVANAGVQLFGADRRAHELDLDVWRRTIEVNLTGTFLTCKHSLRAMLETGAGSLIVTGSPTGIRGSAPEFTAYSASKAGVHGLVRVLAAAYAEAGIRVNAVIPGYTGTPLVQAMPAERRRQLIAGIPLGRPAVPEDVTGAMVHLASAESVYTTGSFLVVDGGATLR